MAKKTYYAVVCRGHIVQHVNVYGQKMPLMFLSKAQADAEARERSVLLKKANSVMPFTLNV